jgi:hypothetical protein
MGETHETKNVVSEEATLLAERLIQTMNDTLQNNQVIMQYSLEEMQNHLSMGHAKLKICFTNFQKGQDRMIAIMEEQRKHHSILSQFLMEQRHGKDPPLFGGNQGAGGSHRGTCHDEESGHKDHAEDTRSFRGTHSHSHIASRTTPRPYMPTFLEARPRDTNAFGYGGIEEEWKDLERAYNSVSAGFQR